MSVTLTIDHREGGLKDLFKADATVLYDNLLFGDAVIQVDDCPLVVIERKTLMDLAASIKDGRYKNQKTKMCEHVEQSKLYYIIEGTFDFGSEEVALGGISKKSIVSCVINTLVRDNIKVLTTRNVKETYFLIDAMYERIKADPGKYVKSENGDHERVISKPKAKTLTTEECFESQLCQVPDVSLKSARAILKTFPSMKELYLQLGPLSDDEKLKRLKELMLEDSKGKQRRISERVVKNILQYMF